MALMIFKTQRYEKVYKTMRKGNNNGRMYGFYGFVDAFR